tara:strand:- start:205 stop:693 length:489 start_codon:yes stop_codon:yes gene_type:complete
MAIKDTTKKPYIADREDNVFIGLDLPIRRGDGIDGYFASTSTTIEAVKNNIRNLLLTESGERVMQPDFGLNLRSVLFEPLTEDLIFSVQEEIVNKMAFWLPFVNLTDIQIFEPNNDNGYDVNTVTLKIEFNIQQDPTTLNTIQVDVNQTGGSITPVTNTGGY